MQRLLHVYHHHLCPDAAGHYRDDYTAKFVGRISLWEGERSLIQTLG